MKSRYRELGLELVSLGDNHSFQPKHPPLVEEKGDDRNIYFQYFSRAISHTTKEREDGQLHPDPSTIANDGRGTLNKHPFQRCDTLLGTI
jgi:hypothetical protein